MKGWPGNFDIWFTSEGNLKYGLLPTEVGRYFAPFLGLPFNDGIAEIVGL